MEAKKIKHKKTETINVDQLISKARKLIDSLPVEKRLESIKEIISALKFEERFHSLSDKELFDICERPFLLSDKAEKKLRECKNDNDINLLINEYARSRYFRDCAWGSFLNGETENKPLM
jgi:hypothetical protein